MTQIVLYVEVKSDDVVETFTVNQLIDKLAKTRNLSRPQLYRWLKHLEIKSNWKDGYTSKDYVKILRFAKLMNRYKSVKKSLIELQKFYPEINHDSKQRIQKNEHSANANQSTNQSTNGARNDDYYQQRSRFFAD